MCNRNRFALTVLTLLCSQGLSAHAGSVGYEALDGNRCNVSTDAPSQLQFNSGYSEAQGTNASFGITIPLGSSTGKALDNCLEFARTDQSRQHFAWLVEMYERGVITRESLLEEAGKLGIKLATEVKDQTGGMSILLTP